MASVTIDQVCRRFGFKSRSRLWEAIGGGLFPKHKARVQFIYVWDAKELDDFARSKRRAIHQRQPVASNKNTLSGLKERLGQLIKPTKNKKDAE